MLTHVQDLLRKPQRSEDWAGKDCHVEFGGKNLGSQAVFCDAKILELLTDRDIARVLISEADPNAKSIGVQGLSMAVNVKRIRFVTAKRFPASPSADTPQPLLNVLSKSISFIRSQFPKGQEKPAPTPDPEPTLPLSNWESITSSLKAISTSVNSFLGFDEPGYDEDTATPISVITPSKTLVSTPTEFLDEKENDDDGLCILDYVSDYFSGCELSDAEDDEFDGLVEDNVEDMIERISSMMTECASTKRDIPDEAPRPKSNHQVVVGEMVRLPIGGVMYEAKIVQINWDGTWAIRFVGEDCLRMFRPDYVVRKHE